MYRIKYLCALITAFLFLFSNRVSSQVKTDPELFTLFQQSNSVDQKYSSHLKDASNEFDILVSLGFLVYKETISSQDQPSCVFTPSCSEYAVEAFQKKGMITGWLQTFDRLSRCHGLANHSHYHFDKEKNRFYDPVQ
jgi:putative component of membrane protein insertase Oxa1/YidC/SpoIIIJ protein YidD